MPVNRPAFPTDLLSKKNPTAITTAAIASVTDFLHYLWELRYLVHSGEDKTHAKVTIKPERFLEPWFERIEVGWKMFDFVGLTFISSCGVMELSSWKKLQQVEPGDPEASAEVARSSHRAGFRSCREPWDLRSVPPKSDSEIMSSTQLISELRVLLVPLDTAPLFPDQGS